MTQTATVMIQGIEIIKAMETQLHQLEKKQATINCEGYTETIQELLLESCSRLLTVGMLILAHSNPDQPLRAIQEFKRVAETSTDTVQHIMAQIAMGVNDDEDPDTTNITD